MQPLQRYFTRSMSTHHPHKKKPNHSQEDKMVKLWKAVKDVIPENKVVKTVNAVIDVYKISNKNDRVLILSLIGGIIGGGIGAYIGVKAGIKMGDTVHERISNGLSKGFGYSAFGGVSGLAWHICTDFYLFNFSK